MTLPGCSTHHVLPALTPKKMGAMAGDNSGVRAMFQPRSVVQKRAEALGVRHFFDHNQIVRCRGPLYVPQTMWMGCPDQTGSLQGHPRVSGGGLAGNDSGTGSGWQQSRQN